MGGSARQPDDFAFAFDSAFAALQVRIESACAAQPAWPEQVAGGIRAAFDWVAAEPVAAQLLTNDALAGGSAGFERYERMIAYIAELLEPGREQADHGGRLPKITERAMASGVAMLVAQRLSLGQEAALPAIAGEAIQFVLTPYLGGSEARRVASSGPI
jgi:AcrR family transcriptional regulator